MAQETGRDTPTILVVGHLEFEPEDRERWLACAAQVVADTRAEPGVIEYSVLADPLDPRRVVIAERYRDPQAVVDHVAAEHYQKFKAAVADIPVKSGPDFVRCFEGLRFDPAASTATPQG